MRGRTGETCLTDRRMGRMGGLLDPGRGWAIGL